MRHRPHARNARATTVSGTRYRSGAEAAVAQDAERRGLSVQYEAERIPYVQERVHVIDFTLIAKSGKTIRIEFKGWLTPDDRRKILDFRKSNPDMDYRLLFQANQTCKRATPSNAIGSLKRDARWCNRNGIKWADGLAIPEAWGNE